MIISFFRDFLDGWIYVLYVIICLCLFFLFIRLLCSEEESLVVSKDYNFNNDNINESNNHFKYTGDMFDEKK